MARHVERMGNTLRVLRQFASMTLADVADEAGTSVAYLSKVERGIFVPTDQYVAMVTAAIAHRLLLNNTSDHE
ncbi:helix-turn-helix domain-containing protein [Lysinibacter cavernae]|uniref:Transcriptional regulator with XRE-family HTH domain n=1 Tax=Lysinibacter cavernae TaxID=1640652 RepID=A0A7X5R278_9MICO|nr:helix-turn-helix transcriptional regulator [Lysinibacter cavernae]NIH54244.1 transcriptional regulator with XRE-family HTH domain [Lysinibacter cavernae]